MSLVLDASVLAEFLVGSEPGEAASARMAEHAGDLHIPHLAVVESLSVLRSWAYRGEISSGRADGALDDLAVLPARRWPAEPLLKRVWELRSFVSAYDATYVALAEALGADLLTTDDRLVRGIEGRSTCRVLPLVV